MPMVSPPLEVVGTWKGSNCGIDDPSPTPAQLEMYPNGTNLWIFDGEIQTGSGVEAVVGWHCIDVGVGYWWGMVPYDDVLWCNLFQVTRNEAGEDVYINYALGGEGIGAQTLGSCPEDVLPEATNTGFQPLQASFSKLPSAVNAVQMTCRVPAGQPQPSCNSLFTDDAVPNPFAVGKSLPVINATTCAALDDTSSSPQIPWCMAAMMSLVALGTGILL